MQTQHRRTRTDLPSTSDLSCAIDLHAALSCALQVCGVLHLAGVALGSYLERQNLVRGMLSGKKHVDDIGRA